MGRNPWSSCGLFPRHTRKVRAALGLRPESPAQRSLAECKLAFPTARTVTPHPQRAACFYIRGAKASVGYLAIQPFASWFLFLRSLLQPTRNPERQRESRDQRTGPVTAIGPAFRRFPPGGPDVTHQG